jgi:hypothetical protein
MALVRLKKVPVAKEIAPNLLAAIPIVFPSSETEALAALAFLFTVFN